MNLETATAIPAWFWLLFALGTLGALSLFGKLIVATVQRELKRLDEIPTAIRHLDQRVTRLEARDGVGREIATEIRRLVDERAA